MRGDESRTRWAAKFFQVWDVRLEIACQATALLAFFNSDLTRRLLENSLPEVSGTWLDHAAAAKE